MTETSAPPTFRIPGSDIVVPPLAIGTMYWGIDVAPADAHAMLDSAIDRGASFVDTANNYAFWRDGGTGDESETTLGEWIAARGVSGRAALTLATKVGARPKAADASDLSDPMGLAPSAVAEQLRESLRRLRTDHVDLVYAHIDDDSVPVPEVIGGMRALVDDGLARAVAASNLTAPRLREAVGVEGPGYAGLQNRFTYLTPAHDADLAPHVLLDDDVAGIADDAGLLLFGYSSLLGGAYTRTDRPLPDGYRHAGTDAALDTLGAVADAHGIDRGQAVLAWMTQRRLPVVPIVGVSRPEQLTSAIAAVTTPLSAEELARLDDARA